MVNAEEKAYRFIISSILSRYYHPGDFLLEMDLAEKLEMSRTPVSRALMRLVSEGFLNKMPKKGCYIPVPTPADAKQVFTGRMCAEAEAAGLAAKNAGEDEILALEHYLNEDKLAYERKDRENWANINEVLHLGIARIGHNPYVEKWVQNMFWRSNVYVFYFDGFYEDTDIVVIHETLAQHEAVMKAIRAHDEDKARELMRNHIFTTYSKLLLR